MSVSGLCQICEAAEARFSCPNCGQLVCADHYERGTGLCLECARASGVRSSDRTPDDYTR